MSFYGSEPREPGSFSSAVGPVIAQIIMVACLASPLFMSRDSVLETGIRVIALYLFFEATRRAGEYFYTRIVTEYSTIKTFSQKKSEYDWILAYLSGEAVATRPHGITDKVDDDELLPIGKPRNLRFNGSWVEIIRTEFDSYSYRPDSSRYMIQVKVYSFSSSALTAFLEETKKQYMNARCSDARVHYIKSPYSSFDTYSANGNWNETKCKSAASLLLSISDHEMDSLVHEAREFFDSSDWYSAAGIPWHKTYLLHGPEKTIPANVVLTLGARLQREIFYLNLAPTDTNFNNTYLTQAMSSIPKGSIFVIENIDRASGGLACDYPYNPNESRSLVTCAAIRDALLGWARAQGILVFVTVVNVDRVDKELFKSGAIDAKIECKYATKEQIVTTFNRFFPTSHGIPESAKGEGFSGDIKAPLLSDLAEAFASQVPENEFAIRDLQRYLVPHRTSPGAAVLGIKQWVDDKSEEKRIKLEEDKTCSPYGHGFSNCPGPCCSSAFRPYTPFPPLPPPPIVPWVRQDDTGSSVDVPKVPTSSGYPVSDEKPEAISEKTEVPVLESPAPIVGPFLSPLERTIVNFIEAQPGQAEGVPLTTISKTLTEQDESLCVRQVREALEILTEDGFVFTTIDDSHFKTTA